MSAFWSRWASVPVHARELEPTALPAGFRAAGVRAQIKQSGRDVGLLVCDTDGPSSCARFTRSAVQGAPVVASRETAVDRLRAVVASSGNANVLDGKRGLDTARLAQAEAAKLIEATPSEVGVAATGPIGRELPRERLLEGVRQCGASLSDDTQAFCEAILTTDRGPKRMCLEVELSAGSVRLAAQAKGAGMISPDFATMFCFVETDAAVSAQTLDLLTSVCVKRSFDRISVDGQLSTSDSVFCFASGESRVVIAPETPDELALGEAMDAVMRQLALEIVADGEGAKRIGRVVVRGLSGEVESVARAIANSPLVKTALHGGDPNFGRIVQAVGAVFDAEYRARLDLAIEGIEVVRAGSAVELSQAVQSDLAEAVSRREVEYVITLPGAADETELFFSDLSTGYVELNVEYGS